MIERPLYSSISLLKQSDSGFTEIAKICRKPDGMVEVVPKDKLSIFSDSDFLSYSNDLKEGEYLYSERSLSPDNNSSKKSKELIILCPVYNKRTNKKAVIAITLDFKEFTRNIKMFSEDLEFFIADQHGNYIFSSESSRVKNSINKKSPLQIQDDFPGIDFFTPFGIKKISNHPLNFKKLKIAGKKMNLIFTHLNLNTDIDYPHSRFLVIGAIASNNYIATESYNFLTRLFYLIIITIVIITIITIIATQFLTRPILDLTEAADKIAAGEKDLEIPVHGKDEVSVLANSLKTMVKSLNESQEKLQDLNKTLEERVEERTRELQKTNNEMASVLTHAQQMAKEAEQANQAKNEFIANMSHEVRTPMHAMLGFTSLLLEGNLTEQQREAMLNIEMSANSLLNIINNILDISKIEAGKIELEETVFDIKELIYDVCSLILAKKGDKPVELLCDIAENIHCDVEGDANKIKQVLLNLLRNSHKFTTKGEILVTLKVMEEDENKIKYRISIRDTGVGIPQDKLESIFESFTQADSSSTREFEGLGLGLTLCDKLARVLNGRIFAESEVGKGATFHFEIPLRKHLGIPGLFIFEDDKSEFLKDKRSLIIDDNLTAGKITSNMLADMGGQIEMASNSKDALKMLKENSFDFIFLDAALPNTGDLKEYIKKAYQEKRLIAFLMLVNPYSTSTMLDKSVFYSYLQKPLNPQFLKSSIEAALRNTGIQ
jgi:signal transduction histidine kinase/BarA-like signal transduction histidine kinase